MTFYHMVTGEVPFSASTIYDIMELIVKGDPEPARRLNRDVPELVSDVTARMMARKPRHRYPSIDELLAVLGDLEHGVEAPAEASRSVTGGAARTTRGKRRKRERGRSIAGQGVGALPTPFLGVVCAALAGTAALALWGSEALAWIDGTASAVRIFAGWVVPVALLPWITPSATRWALGRNSNAAAMVVLAGYDTFQDRL